MSFAIYRADNEEHILLSPRLPTASKEVDTPLS